MPSRKQRRRRVKERRHEYEIVYVDDEGRELPPEEVEADEEPQARRTAARDGKPKQKAAKAPTGGRGVSGRQAQPPSWRRIGKRALIFGPFMFLTIALLERNAGLGAQLFITGQMLLLFIPFSYVMDRMLYRRFLRQSGGAEAESSRRRA